MGALVAGTLAALVALVTNGPAAALIVVLIVVVVNHLEGYFLHPVVMGHTLRLHGLVVLLAVRGHDVIDSGRDSGGRGRRSGPGRAADRRGLGGAAGLDHSLPGRGGPGAGA
ncbi:AI-2E family transporter [Kocuria sp. CPCC 205316]|uniref:AI-2E family transporter n=1 Tax=Kocuria TaxID=57493 RepID=UPI0036DEA05A